MPYQLLVADDSVTMQKVVQITFDKEDFQVTAVSTGEEAINQAKSVKPDVVIIDIDLNSPVDGYSVCQSLKNDPETQATKVCLLASQAEPFDEAKAQQSGADAHVVKPFESQTLLDRIRELVGAPAQAAVKPNMNPVTSSSPVAPPAATVPPAATPPAAPPAAAPPAAAPPAAAPPAAAPHAAAPAAAAPPAAAPPAAAPPAAAPPAAAPPVAAPPVAASPTVPPPSGPGGIIPSGGGIPAPPSAGGPISGGGIPAPPTSPASPPPAAAPPAAAAPPPAPAATPTPAPTPAAAAPPPKPATPPPPASPAPAAAAPPPPAATPSPSPSAAATAAGVNPGDVEALTRRVIEEVVWEVVPQLAETLIREKLAELIKNRQ